MTWRFRRSIRLAPGFRLNLGKRGMSLSAGVRGAHVTIGRRGVRTTVGVPGTGLSWTELQHPSRQAPSPAIDADQDGADSAPMLGPLARAILWGFAGAGVIALAVELLARP